MIISIRILSDLHTEFYKDNLYPVSWEGEDLLILAGDIGVGVEQTVWTIKRFLGEGVPEILFVTGNHEYYNGDFDKVNEGFRDALEGYDNVHFLNRDTVKIGDVHFIGASLWTNFNNEDWFAVQNARKNISDFQVIKRGDKCFTPDDAIAEFNKDYGYIKAQYEAIDGKKVIVTHFLPAQACIAPRYRGANLLNYYFANQLDNWIGYMTDTIWVHGHTHDNVDIMLGDTRILCNPNGYPNEGNMDFDTAFIIDL